MVLFVSCNRGIQRARQHARRLEPGIDRHHALEAGDEQTGADEEHERQGDLARDQDPADGSRAAARRPASSFLTDGLSEVDAAQQLPCLAVEDEEAQVAVTDHAKAQGAIVGKAMTPLESGKGLVLVLVTLQ